MATEQRRMEDILSAKETPEALETIAKLCEYRADDGTIRSRVTRRGVLVGSRMGWLDKTSTCVGRNGKVYKRNNPYRRRRLTVLGITYAFSRVCWALYYGHWPHADMVVDHVDNDPRNNRINNLQEITMSDNAKKRHILQGR